MNLLLTAQVAQIREQILVPDLYVLTVESVAYKKRLKREKKNLTLFHATFQCGRYSVFKKKLKKHFLTRKSEKTGLKSCSESAQTLLLHSPAQTTAHIPELIFYVMKSRDQTSVLLSMTSCFMLQMMIRWHFSRQHVQF